MLSDLRFALRSLAKSPGFTAVTVITLALGIGACTAIFSVVNSVLLRPMGYRNPDRIVALYSSRLPQQSTWPVSPADFLDWAAETRDIFTTIYAERRTAFTFMGTGEPRRLVGVQVTAAYFATLGIPPMLGRAFTAEEDTPGKSNVVVLNHGFWQREFAGRTSVLGERIRLNNQLYTVIGIMPPVYQQILSIDLITPMAWSNQERTLRGSRVLSVFAKLQPGVTPAQAEARLATITAQLEQRYPDTNKNWRSSVISILENRTAAARPMLYSLLGATALLQLIACANVANLLLARATRRQREISVRAALGASRWQIARQLLSEGLVLAAMGGATGTLIAKWGLDTLLAMTPPGVLTRSTEVTLDGRAVLVTVLLTLLTGVAFSLAPALQCSRTNPVETLKDAARGSSEGGRRGTMRHSLVVAEIALALILLTSAGLLIRNFARLTHFDPGLQPSGAVLVSVTTPAEKYHTPDTQDGFVRAVLERYRTLPGVIAAAATHAAPLVGDAVLSSESEDQAFPPGDGPLARFYSTTPDYLAAAGIPLIRGRNFTEQDRTGAIPVALVSESFAAKYFPGSNAIGKRIATGESPRLWREIVGIVGDVNLPLQTQSTTAQVYLPFAQFSSNTVTFVVRAAGDPLLLASELRRAVYAIDPEQPVTRIVPMEKLLRETFARERFAATLLGTFSGIGLVLAAVGIYSVMAYGVAQRTVEFGIRIALGARPADVFRQVILTGSRLVAFGIAIGLAGSVAAARLIQSQLYQAPEGDPLVFVAVVAVLASVAMIACVLPSWRATRVDPMIALRAE